MNEKFFDLKKEKQDRMINGALKVFAQNGYGHASTDDIVKEAAISKGLLFHYFISKIGLYSFVYDYSVKYLQLELSTGVSGEGTDYFEMLNQIFNCEMLVMKTYPYLIQFLNESKRENVSEALIETEEKRIVFFGQYEQMLKKADISGFKSDVDVNKITRMIMFTVQGLMSEQFTNGSFQPEQFYKEVKQYLAMIKQISYAE